MPLNKKDKMVSVYQPGAGQVKLTHNPDENHKLHSSKMKSVSFVKQMSGKKRK